MRLPQISLLLTVALGLTQVLAIPTSGAETTEAESRDASAQLSRVMARAPKPKPFRCPLRDTTKCTSCGPMLLKKGSSKRSCEGDECKREEAVQQIDKRVSGMVRFDEVAGVNWGPEDQFGTQGLGSCSFVAIYDEHYIAGAHIPPSRAARNQQGQLVLVATGAQVIYQHLSYLNTHLPYIRGARHAVLVTSTGLDEEERSTMRNWLVQAGAQIRELTYNPAAMTRGGVFFLSRKNNAWLPTLIGPT
ncbi:MAG: hypothetical protein M1821_004592 [Bathelium mastoideum]|nr:MAG: hypothetical protein M1821_004592 [Bathelium mastoideum]